MKRAAGGEFSGHSHLVRYAVLGDLNFVAQDGYLPASVVATKIESRHVAMAERDAEPVG